MTRRFSGCARRWRPSHRPSLPNPRRRPSRTRLRRARNSSSSATSQPSALRTQSPGSAEPWDVSVDDLAILRALIDDTPGAAAQLALAHAASREGRHAESQVHCAITADAIAITHPEAVEDPRLLTKVLQRLFLE